MLSVLNQPIVFECFLSAFQCTGRLLPYIYVARACENGWGTEKNHEKAVEIVQEWSDITGEYADEAMKVRDEILSDGKKETKRIEFLNGDVYEGESADGRRVGIGRFLETVAASQPENEDISSLKANTENNQDKKSSSKSDKKEMDTNHMPMSADEAYDIAEAFYNQGKYEESCRYYSMAAKQGHTLALNCLAWNYRYGEGVEVDIDKALSYYRLALKQGNTKAAGNIGNIYYYGESGIESEPQKAFPLLKQAAMAGHGFAMTTLSDIYYRGNACDSNEKLAAYWAYKAVMNGSDGGYYWLGIFFDEGIFFHECPVAAKYYFEIAAEKGYDVDEYLKSPKYQHLVAVEPDFITFNENEPNFFTEECPYKQYLSALCMLNGENTEGELIPVDPIEGRRLLEKAAEQGYAEAQYSLGVKFLNTNNGDGVQYDDDGSVLSLGCDTAKALKYLDLAARHGQEDALDLLIGLYAIGDIDIEEDMRKSDEYSIICNTYYQKEDDDSEDDESNYYDSLAEEAWREDDFFRCCYYMRRAGRMYREYQSRYQTSHYYCREDREGEAYNIVKELIKEKKIYDISKEDARLCLYLLEEFIPYDTDREALALCYYRLNNIKKAAGLIGVRILSISDNVVQNFMEETFGLSFSVPALSDEIAAARMLEKAQAKWERGKVSNNINYFAQRVDKQIKIIKKYIEYAYESSYKYRLYEIEDEVNQLEAEVKLYLM